MTHTKRYVEMMLIIACFLYFFIGNMDVYINVYTMMIPRYCVLIQRLSIGKNRNITNVVFSIPKRFSLF